MTNAWTAAESNSPAPQTGSASAGGNAWTAASGGNAWTQPATPAPKPHKNVKQVVTRAGKAFNNAWDQAKYMGTHPVELMGAIDGSVGRAIEGGIVGAAGPHKNPFEAPVVDMLGSAWNAVTHPGAQIALDRHTEHALGLHPIKQAAKFKQPAQDVNALAASIPETDARLGVLGSPHQSIAMAGGALQNIASLATQQGLDAAVEQVANLPSYIFKRLSPEGLMLEAGEKLVPRVLARTVGKEGAEHIATAFNPYHGVNRDLEAVPAAQIRGENAIARNAAKMGRKTADQLVEKHKDVLGKLGQMFHGPGSRVARRQYLLKNPETAEIIHELDRVSWVEGTGQVRRQMLQHGYVPPEDVKNLPAGNTLHHWDENYFPTQAVSDPHEGKPLGAWRKSKSNAAGYNLRGGDGHAEDNVAEQVRQRIAHGYRNAADAQFRRQAIRAAQGGAKPEAEMSHVDLNSRDAGGRPAGNIFQPYSDAVQKATVRDISHGNSPYAAFQPPEKLSRRVNADIQLGNGDPYLRKPIPTAPLKVKIARAKAALERAQAAEAGTKEGVSQFGLGVQKNVSKAVNASRADLTQDLFKLAGHADQAARDTSNAASQAALNTQKKVSEAADALRTKQALAGQKQVDRIIKARSADTSSPMGKIAARMRDDQERRTGADFMPIRNAAVTKDLDTVIKPPARVAEQAGKVASKAMDGTYHDAISRAALGGSVDKILRGTKQQAERATRDLIASEGKLAAANHINETVERVSGLIDHELARTGNVQIPKSVEDLLFNRSIPPSVPMLPEIANVFRDATFAIPYVHGWNLTQQTLAHGLGPDTVARGMSYARRLAKGDPELQGQLGELQRLGQAAEYSAHNEPAFGKLPVIGKSLGEMSNKGQATLDNIDHGLKLAAMEKLQRTEGLSGPLLGARLESIYGNSEASWVAQLLRGMGGFFANWRLNVLPKTVYHALKTEPGRRAIREMDWAQNFFTQESEYEPNHETPTEVQLFPALNEAQELIFGGPFGAVKYATSSGTLGVIPELIALQHEKGTTALSQVAAGTTPYAPIAQLIMDLQKRNPGITAEDVLSLIGPRLTPERGSKAANAAYKQKRKFLPQSYPGMEAIP